MARVPAYSLHAAVHTVALILTLNRKIHGVTNRALDRLLGFDFNGTAEYRVSEAIQSCSWNCDSKASALALSQLSKDSKSLHEEPRRRMTAYSFQIRDGVQVFRFRKAMALPNAPAALRAGRAAAWAFMDDLSSAVGDWSTWRVEILDESGRTRVVMPFILNKAERQLVVFSPKDAPWD